MISFEESEKISQLESQSMVQSSHQGQKEEDSVSLEEDLNLSHSDDDEDLYHSCRPGQSSSSASSSREQIEKNVREGETKDDYAKLVWQQDMMMINNELIVCLLESNPRLVFFRSKI